MAMMNQSAGQTIGRPTWISSLNSKPPHGKSWRAWLTGILVAAGLAAAVAAPAWADTEGAADPQSVALDQWRAVMAQNPPQEPGCFRERYPSLVREKVTCQTELPRRAHPVHREAQGGGPAVVGNTTDYVAETKHNTFWAGGNFSDVSMHSEASVGMDGFNYQGILGPDEYSLQINTNDQRSTSACDGRLGGVPLTFDCTVWQQFVYATDYDCDIWGCTGAVFIQFWLINYGVCPSGWNQSGEENCWINGNVTSAPDFPMTDLANLSLHAAAHPGGEDCVEVYDNTGMGWDACVNDSVLDISSVWKQTEFGVFGDGGGSQAAFGFGTRFTQYLQVNDGSSDKPTCLGPASAGFTGETNNLNQGKCDAEAGVPDGHFPRIKFTESNPFSPPPAPTQCGFILPGQGLTPGHSWHSCNKRFKLAMQTDSNLVLYEGETALWNTSTVGADAAFVVMQAADGNLVIYNTGEGAVWASDTSGFEGAYLSIQNDGNLVIYSGNEAIWASNTGGH